MKKIVAETADSNWSFLFKIGGVAALICAAMYPVTLAFFIPVNRAGTTPGTVLEWFTMFQKDPLTGLFLLGLADIFIVILWIPMALALYAALNQNGKAWAKVAAALVLVGSAVYLATNTAFSMLMLSRQYAAAGTEVEQIIARAAGQAILAINEGTGAYTGMPLVWLGGLILSILMLKSKTFGKAAAWVGIVGLGLLAASIPFAGYTTTGPAADATRAIVAVTYIGGGLLSLAWYILVGIRLLKLGRSGG